MKISGVIIKIISGGNTGVERGALESALDMHIPYGGVVSKNLQEGDGIISEKFNKLEPLPEEDCLSCIEWNIEHSDATLIIQPNSEKKNPTYTAPLHRIRNLVIALGGKSAAVALKEHTKNKLLN